ncbi:hypothetical protein B0T22DRAFT_457257 [Podospora appendiculata]|uniref:Uncharacterized protein n=1 Tax=Podospora appendiculata TaxID=314037 RepID=A0AAE0X7G9_9PEZI|nr:hypothetical protein B0T22DRAFT_457257 [Podospora appendiculata]
MQSTDWSAAMVREYWAPACQYSTADAATYWRSFIRRERFATWERAVVTEAARYPNSHPGGEKLNNTRSQHINVRTTAITLPWSGEIIEVPVLADDSDLTSTGHDLAAGSHIFRVSQDPKRTPLPRCLQYEGQIPRPSCDYLRRFKTRVLPDVIDAVISLLSSSPMAGSRQQTSTQLQLIRNKGGDIDQDDLALLLRIWRCKFTDCRDDGTPVSSPNKVPHSHSHSHSDAAARTYAEAAWLVYQLRRSPLHQQQPFEWH